MKKGWELCFIKNLPIKELTPKNSKKENKIRKVENKSMALSEVLISNYFLNYSK